MPTSSLVHVAIAIFLIGFLLVSSSLADNSAALAAGYITTLTQNYVLFTGTADMTFGGTSASPVHLVGDVGGHLAHTALGPNTNVVLIGTDIQDADVNLNAYNKGELVSIAALKAASQSVKPANIFPDPGELGGKTLVAGVYSSLTTLQITGDLILDGGGKSDGLFVFHAASSLTAITSSRVVLINGALACNVFWYIEKSAALETYSTFRGTIYSGAGITVALLAVAHSRLFASTSITMQQNTITLPCSSLPDPIVISKVDICSTVGIYSGCSGCELGTSNFCKYVVKVDPVTKGNYFECLHLKSATSDIIRKVNGAKSASFLCPVDPYFEPKVPYHMEKCELVYNAGTTKTDRICSIMSFDQTGTVWSQAYENDKLSFGRVPSGARAPYTVDRTAYFSDLGQYHLLPSLADKGTKFDSRKFCSILNLNKVKSPFDYAISMGVTGEIKSERDRFCARLLVSYVATSACPKYGLAMTGICQNLHQDFVDACVGNPYSNIESNIYGSLLPIVPDDARFCLNEYTFGPTGWSDDVILGLYNRLPYVLNEHL